MKRIRRVFLAIWIPMMILVSLALIGTIGREIPVRGSAFFSSDTYFKTGREFFKTGFIDILPGIVLQILVTISLFWMVGLEEDEKTKLRKT